MIDHLLALPRQLRDAWAIAQRLALPDDYRRVTNVVICGMGGSAIGGDLTRTLVEDQIRVPVSVVRAYDLPAFVEADTLVVLSSFSGGTEETLSACDQALERGARCIAITGGGRLAERAAARGFPAIGFSFDGRPREVLGYSTLLMLGVLVHLGLALDPGPDVEASARLLERMAEELGPGAPSDQNQARQLTRLLRGRVGVVYGGGLMAEVARRWKGQLNENGKTWAFFEQLPELNHNAVLGYHFPVDAAEHIAVVMLSSGLSHPRIKLRERVTIDLLESFHIPIQTVEAWGNSPLEHVFSAAYIGDFVSYYLALANRVDPADNGAIDYLKSRLANEPALERA
jgi:glucose/mannose-6-phosphate isomerase